MTFNTRTTLISAALFLATAGMVTSPAQASTQDDVAECRIAMQAQTAFDMDDYRLRFLKKDGFRNATLTLKAIPKTGGESFTFTCAMRRNIVVAVNTNAALKLAKK